jgi:hypothetical protein
MVLGALVYERFTITPSDSLHHRSPEQRPSGMSEELRCIRGQRDYPAVASTISCQPHVEIGGSSARLVSWMVKWSLDHTLPARVTPHASFAYGRRLLVRTSGRRIIGSGRVRCRGNVVQPRHQSRA